MRFVLTSPDGGQLRFNVDECIVLRSDKPGEGKAVIVTKLGNWAVMETPEQAWKLVK